MDDEKIKDNIKKIFSQVFPTINENFDWEKQQKDYENWDSFAQLQLITLTEELFKIELDLDDAITITSAQKLFDCVKSLK